ncbi:hypothetical protein EVAR_6839_1 [Eumeta japonica]|uniref:Uncharacterized protein n=1 Tax=Eumeta variegata TaxID=151549 RepID=A0A4C1U708_EUMVA|nr:hypothetical protein EVAR_6839_1 [Eumeta japonica]
MNTYNSKIATNALLASWKGIGYLMDRDNEEERGSGSPAFSLTGRNATTEAATSCEYPVRVDISPVEQAYFCAAPKLATGCSMVLPQYRILW